MSDNLSIINPIISEAQEIVSQSTDVLIKNYRNTVHGANSFFIPESRKPFNDLKEILKLLSSEALECLPQWRLMDLSKILSNIFYNVRRLHDYEVQINRTIEDQQREMKLYFVESPTNIYHWISQAWPIVLEALTLLNQKNQKDSSTEFLQDIKKNLHDSILLKNQLIEMIETARTELTKEGASKHAVIFTDQATRHNGNAVMWRNVSIGLIVLNVFLLTGLFFLILNSPPSDRIVVSVSSLLLVSLVSYCVVLSVRSYFAEKHNEIINQHKANCLSSYRTFTDGNSDGVKEIVLQYTTQTIFSPYNPGFLNKEPIQSPSPILEILRTVAPK
jgi:hypothetical protein